MKIFYGWAIVAACTICKISKAFGQNDTLTYTIPHLLVDFGISRRTLSTVFSLGTISASLAQPFFGRLVDRVGARGSLVAAHFSFAVAVLVFSALSAAHWVLLSAELVCVFFFIRTLSQGAIEVFTSQCVQRWFICRRGQAVSAVQLGVQVGNAFLAPIVSHLVSSVGWRHTAQFGASLNAIVAVLSLIVIRRDPDVWGLLPDGFSSQLRNDCIHEGESVAAPACLSGPRDDDEAIEAEDTCTASMQEFGSIAQDGGSVPHRGAGIAQEEGLPDCTDRWEPCQSKENDEAEETDVASMPRSIFIFYMFTFFYTLLFGGCDFYMMEMLSEAGATDIDAALFIYVPIRITGAICTIIFGLVLDRYAGMSASILACAAFTSWLVTMLLTGFVVLSPTLALVYGLVRGCTGAAWESLLRGGIAFVENGVDRSRVGEALGNNAFVLLIGTGVGPLFYGYWRDLIGSFRVALHVTSLPMLIIAFVLGLQAIGSQGRRKQYGAIEAKLQEDGSPLGGPPVKIGVANGEDANSPRTHNADAMSEDTMPMGA